MRFLHAADIHLDSPLRGLERYEGAPTEELRGATRKALENLVRLAIDERVDFVLIAGDVYDGDWKDYNTGLFFVRQVGRLREAGIPVFLIRGNHDAASQITRELQLPDNVVSFGTKRPETRVFEELGVAVHGQSFASQAVTEDLSANYPTTISGLFNIGLLHTSADGREGHANYAPCTPAGLAAKGYDYWALGHIHQREILGQDPWIVFPGNLQGRHIRETGSKGASLVTVEHGQVRTVVHRDLDVVRWCALAIDASGAADTEELLERVRAGLLEEIAQASDRLIAVRLRIHGACRAHSQLASRHESFVNECRAMAAAAGRGLAWVEKVRVLTSLEVDLDDIASRRDPLGELLRFVRELAQSDSSLTEILGDLKSLKQKLPLELKEGEDPIDLENSVLLRELLRDAEQILLPRLLEEDGQ